MSNIHQKIIDLITAPENRDEIKGAHLTMCMDGTWNISIATKLPAPFEPLRDDIIDPRDFTDVINSSDVVVEPPINKPNSRSDD